MFRGPRHGDTVTFHHWDFLGHKTILKSSRCDFVFAKFFDNSVHLPLI